MQFNHIASQFNHIRSQFGHNWSQFDHIHSWSQFNHIWSQLNHIWSQLGHNLITFGQNCTQYNGSRSERLQILVRNSILAHSSRHSSLWIYGSLSRAKGGNCCGRGVSPRASTNDHNGRNRRPMIRHAVSPRASLVGGLACYDLNEQRLNLLPESNRTTWIWIGNMLESVCGSGFNWPAARRFAKLSPLFRIQLPASTSAMNDSPVQAARCLWWLRIVPWSAVWRVTISRNSVMEFR